MKPRNENVCLGEFRNDDMLVLRPVRNGGWIVTQPGRSQSEIGEELGAFTDTRDMLLALQSALDGLDK